MKKTESTRKDKIMTSPSTTDSLGLSTSSNITIESAGKSGDGSTSLFPDFHEDKNWSSKTSITVYEDDE